MFPGNDSLFLVASQYYQVLIAIHLPTYALAGETGNARWAMVRRRAQVDDERKRRRPAREVTQERSKWGRQNFFIGGAYSVVA